MAYIEATVLSVKLDGNVLHTEFVVPADPIVVDTFTTTTPNPNPWIVSFEPDTDSVSTVEMHP